MLLSQILSETKLSRHFNKNSWYKDKATQINDKILFEESKRSAFSNKHLQLAYPEEIVFSLSLSQSSIRGFASESRSHVDYTLVIWVFIFPDLSNICHCTWHNNLGYISAVYQQFDVILDEKKWLHERRKKQKRMQTTTLYLFCVCFGDETRSRLSYANIRPTY